MRACRSLLAFVLCAVLAFLASGASTNTTVTLFWTDPGNFRAALTNVSIVNGTPVTNVIPAITNITWRVYGTTNVAAPLTVLTNVSVSVTNIPAGPIPVSQALSVTPGPWFFAVTASNFWTESDFSNLAWTPPVPVRSTNLGITLGP